MHDMEAVTIHDADPGGPLSFDLTDILQVVGVAALWAICHLARAWGVWPGGMLRGNGLIGESDVEKLERWIEMISYATFCLLDGAGEEEAFAQYDSLPPSSDARESGM